MIKNIVCIECPKSCLLSVDIENCRVIKVEGNQCPKGEKYAVQEAENPVRILTSAVLAEGLSLKIVPVRTDRPIPKTNIMSAMDEIKKIKLKNPVLTGDVIAENFMGLGINLIVTRQAD